MAKKTLMVVVIDVDGFTNGRKACNNIENMTFKKTDDVIKELLKYTSISGKEGYVSMYELTDFMELCNDQQINLEGSWISYVHLTGSTRGCVGLRASVFA